MKRLVFFLFTLLSFSVAYAQPGSLSQSVYRSRVNDSTAAIAANVSAIAAGYAPMFYNNQATTPHWDIWQGGTGGSYAHVFDFNAGSGAGTPGGSDTQVQFNNSSAFGGDADFTFTGGNTLNVDFAIVDTEAYDATGWNADNSVPTKDAVRDKIETLTSVVGAQDLFITGPAIWPKLTGGCEPPAAFEIDPNTFQSLDFDQTTGESAQFQVVLPRNWNNGTITFTAYWTAVAGTGTLQFDISGAAYSNDDPLTGVMGTAVEIDDTLIAVNDLHITPTSSAMTFAGTPDADFLLITIARDPTEDTLSADAKLLGVRVTITLDASTSE